MDDGKSGDIGDGARKRARLIDVAQRANVSRATAARALGNYGLVTKETRAKVLLPPRRSTIGSTNWRARCGRGAR